MKALAIVAALALVACQERVATTRSSSDEAPKDAISKVSEDGPVKATVQVWPSKPALSDTIMMRLTVEVPDGINVDLPFQEQSLGRFKVATYDHDQHHSGGKQVLVQTYGLQPPSSGRHRIPPLRLEVTDRRTAPAAGSGSGSGSASAATELLTEEIPLEIAPVATDKVSAELKTAKGVLDPDVGGHRRWIILIGGAAIVWLGMAFALWRAVRRRRAVQLKVSAYDTAMERLRALTTRGAPTAEAADGWFVELSGIVRRYLEGRYEIRAPELTTEEFLPLATRSPELTAEHRALLTSFLERCDRVKFAGDRPDANESLAMLTEARGFIEDTRLRPGENLGAAVGGVAA